MVTAKKTSKTEGTTVEEGTVTPDPEPIPDVAPDPESTPEVTPNTDPEPTPDAGYDKEFSQTVQEVLDGRWGSGATRDLLLMEAGHDPDAIQFDVNRRMGAGAPAAHRPSLSEVAQQVIDGHWGSGSELRRKLEGAGYNFDLVQGEVKRISR